MDMPTEKLPMELLSAAGPLYSQALWNKLIPVTGVPEVLMFTFNYVREGFVVDLAPSVEPLLARRVAHALAEILDVDLVQPPREEVWAKAQSVGVDRASFDANYENTQKLFHETRVSGWDVVRYMALGGGLVASYRTEGLLTLAVNPGGLAFGVSAPPAAPVANDGLVAGPDGGREAAAPAQANVDEAGPDSEDFPDAPTFH